MKNTINENYTRGINRLEAAAEQISDIENMAVKSTQVVQQKK